MESVKIQPIMRKSRPSYINQLLAMEVGKTAHFRLIGSAYTNFYNAKWRIEKTGEAHYKMSKVNDTTLSVTRID